MSSSDRSTLPNMLPQEPFASHRLLKATHVLGENPILVVEWGTRRILACNDQVERTFGYTPDELLGGDTRILHVSDDAFDSFGIMSESYMRSNASAYHCHYRMRQKNGSEFPTENVVQVIHDLAEGPLAVVSFIRDLSKSVDIESEYENILDDTSFHPLSMDIPGIVFQRIRDPQGRDRYTYLAGRLLSEHQIDKDKARADPEELFGMIHPEDRRSFDSVLSSTMQSLSGIDVVLRFHPPDGSSLWLRVISRPTSLEDGSVVWDGIAIDISREKDAQDWAVWLTVHDQLTSLLNRTEFVRRVEQELSAPNRRSCPLAVAQIGVRGMLKINESQGISVGDEVLRQLSQRIDSVLGEGDFAARSHGDIFLVKADVAGSDADLAAAVERLRSVCDEPFDVKGEESVRLEISIGIARFPSDADDADTLLRAAALADERAHKRVGVAYEFYDAALAEGLRQRFRLESNLRIAIEREQLQAYYQPQVSLTDETLVGLEALVRWPQEGGELISPGDFVPVAEQTGLIAPMGRLIVRQVIADQRKWSRLGGSVVPVAVNCSARQLRDTGFVDALCQDVVNAGGDLRSVHLELTESSLVEDFENTQKIMVALTEMGARFSIDDFGTGFSAFNYLARLPFHVLKIDRSFTAEVSRERRAHAIALGLVQMASALGLYTIAEGIETAEQAQTMQQIGCDAAQGFYYSAALPADEIESWLV